MMRNSNFTISFKTMINTNNTKIQQNKNALECINFSGIFTYRFSYSYSYTSFFFFVTEVLH